MNEVSNRHTTDPIRVLLSNSIPPGQQNVSKMDAALYTKTSIAGSPTRIATVRSFKVRSMTMRPLRSLLLCTVAATILGCGGGGLSASGGAGGTSTGGTNGAAGKG